MTLKDWVVDRLKREAYNRIVRSLREKGVMISEKKTTVEYRTEEDLKEHHILDILGHRIKALESIEEAFIKFQEMQRELMEIYLRVGFLNCEDGVKEVSSFAKMGNPAEKPKKNRPKKEEGWLRRAVGDDEVVKRAEYYPVKINIGEKPLILEENESPRKENLPCYIVPPSKRIRYWSSILNDKDDFANEYDVSYFGYEKIDIYMTHYTALLNKIFERAKERYKEEGMNPDNLKKLDTLKTALARILSHIRNQIHGGEATIYGNRKDYIIPYEKIYSKYESMKKLKLPHDHVHILFKHTYMIVDPEKIINQAWYFNPQRFLDKLVSLNKELDKKDRVPIAIEIYGEIIDVEEIQKAMQNIYAKEEEIKIQGGKIRQIEIDFGTHFKEEESRIRGDYEKITKMSIRNKIMMKGSADWVDIIKKMIDNPPYYFSEREKLAENLKKVVGISDELHDEIKSALIPHELERVLSLALDPDKKIKYIRSDHEKEIEDINRHIRILKNEIEKIEPRTKKYDKFVKTYKEIEDKLFSGKEVSKDDIEKAEREYLPACREVLKRIKERYEKEKEFPYLMMDDTKGGEDSEANDIIRGNLIPGLDENGWPLEVTEPGQTYDILGKPFRKAGYCYVLVDIFDYILGKRTENQIRMIPERFVKPMDPLAWSVFVSNEFDTIRDDIREGWYHHESLTVLDYIMAQKRVKLANVMPPEYWAVPTINREKLGELGPEWEPVGEDVLEDKKRREGYISNTMMRCSDGRIIGGGKRIPCEWNPAFDRRYLKLEAHAEREKFRHVGRKYYYDAPDHIHEAIGEIKEITGTDADNSAGLNNEGRELMKYIGPCITTRGISAYIIDKLLLVGETFEETKNLLTDVAKSREAWYDFGPRGIGKKGPTNPFIMTSQITEAENDLQETLSIKIDVSKKKD